MIFIFNFSYDFFQKLTVVVTVAEISGTLEPQHDNTIKIGFNCGDACNLSYVIVHKSGA